MKYPKGIIQTNKKLSTYGNRGMSLENDINSSNEYYRTHNIAVIYKKPTPITIVKVDYPSRKEAVIQEAYFNTPSTTDYNGIYKGKYIDFEAKETKQNRFPLTNIHAHQLEHIRLIIEHGGIGFLLVRFLKSNETFLLDGNKLFDFLEQTKQKSIPIEYFKQEGFFIPIKYAPRIPYLSIVEEIYFKGEAYEENT